MFKTVFHSRCDLWEACVLCIYFILPTCCDICHIQYSSTLICTVDCGLCTQQIFAVQQKLCYGNHCSLVERCKNGDIVNICTPEPLQGRGIDIITVARGWLQTISGWCDLWWCATSHLCNKCILQHCNVQRLRLNHRQQRADFLQRE